MKPLNYQKPNTIRFYDEIIQNKHLVARQPLQALRKHIKRQYKRYRKHIHKLEQFTATSIRDKNNHPFLVGCYTSDTEGLETLKQALEADLGKPRCPFCGLNAAKTLDHYLPKSLFPEFAVLYWNLIPCCYDCNITKKEKYLQGGTRMFAHAGADRFPQVPLFEVKLILGPALNFEVLPHPRLPTVWHNHLINLDLCTRYRDQYSPLFENTVENAREAYHVEGLTLGQIEKNLSRDCRVILRKQGHNDLELLLKQAIINHLPSVI